MGPMPPRKGGVNFVIVTVDYFTKWVEMEPFVTIITTRVTRLMWKAIVCRFGIPRAMKELPGVLWAYQTTVKTPTGKTSFALIYGSEVVIPVEVGITSYKVQYFEK